MTKTLLAGAALAFALSACSSGDTPAEQSAADRAEGHTSSSAGLPPGHIDAGEKLAATKGKATGSPQKDGNAAGTGEAKAGGDSDTVRAVAELALGRCFSGPRRRRSHSSVHAQARPK